MTASGTAQQYIKVWGCFHFYLLIQSKFFHLIQDFVHLHFQYIDMHNISNIILFILKISMLFLHILPILAI